MGCRANASSSAQLAASAMAAAPRGYSGIVRQRHAARRLFVCPCVAWSVQHRAFISFPAGGNSFPGFSLQSGYADEDASPPTTQWPLAQFVSRSPSKPLLQLLPLFLLSHLCSGSVKTAFLSGALVFQFHTHTHTYTLKNGKLARGRSRRKAQQRKAVKHWRIVSQSGPLSRAHINQSEA